MQSQNDMTGDVDWIDHFLRPGPMSTTTIDRSKKQIDAARK